MKSDKHYLAAQITSFIVLRVCSVINNVLVCQLIFGLNFPNVRVILSRKRRLAVIDNALDHPLSSLKFVLIDQVSVKTKEFLEQREGHRQAQLWTYEPYRVNADKEFNSGIRRKLRQYITSEVLQVP